MLPEYFDIYFAIAGVKTNLLGLALVGLLTGIVSGMFGLGGGLITVPYLMVAGIPVQVALATATNQMTSATVSSFISYALKNRVDFKFGALMLFGGIFGTMIGLYTFDVLKELGVINTVIPSLFLVILLIVSYNSAKDAINIWRKMNGKSHKKHHHLSLVLPLQTKFICCEDTLSFITPIMLGLMGGFMVALLGLGGGFIIVPTMIYLLNARERFATGTTNFLIMFTSVISTILHTFSAQNIDIILCMLLIFFTVFGTQLGAYFAHKISADRFRILLAIVLLIISFKFAYSMLIAPENIYKVIKL